MRKIIVFILPCLLMLGAIGCSQDTGTTTSKEVDTKNLDAMDSLSMMFGDLWGAGIKKNRLETDSTANIDKMYQEIEQIIGMDTVNVAYANQIIQLFQSIEKQLGKPLNKDLFMQHLSENMKSSKVASEDELNKMGESLTAQMEKISPGSTHQEPTTFTTSQGTYNINKAVKQMYNLGAQVGAQDRQMHNRNPNLFKTKYVKKKNTKDSFKTFWVDLYGICNNDEAKQVYNQALKSYLKGYNDGWNN